jgi:hypothetical protein
MVACAQGVSSLGTEGLTDDGSGAVSGTATTSAGSGNIGNPGSSQPASYSGAPSYSGATSSDSGAGAPSGGGSTGSTGGSTGSAGGAAGTVGTATGTAGAANTTGACGHFQPGNMGPTLQSMVEPATDAIYFDVEIDNPDDRDINVGDLKFRYYLVASDLGTLSTDIYLKEIKAMNGVTRSVDVDPTVTYADSYFEVSFAGSTSKLGSGESLKVKVHTHNTDYKLHDQTMDYSYNSSTSMTPWCHIVLYELAPAAWGNPPTP